MALPEPKVPAGVRLAATVVVMRGEVTPEIFMVRRSARSPFMPDTFVFPGGRVDDEDGDPDDPQRGFEAFERAARRETMEEASIDLEDRPLTWFDTWLTPSGEGKRRYLARFFAARLAAHEGDDARHDGHETTEGFWSPVDGVLDLWRASRVDLPPPTLSVLLNLAQPRWAQVLDRDPGELRTPILPKVAAVGSAIQIVMPHDPHYRDLDGEGMAAPPRVSDLPTRFLREDKRWRPL